MNATRWKAKLRECLGTLHREFRITVTRDATPDRWVFIIGCYNSGTQLLMHVLGTHPEISSLPQEGQFLTDQLVCDYEIGLPRMWVLREDLFRLTERDEGPDPVRLRHEWLMRLDRRKSVFIEKSPPNTPRTRWLQKHFDNASFIVLVRNGYAVAEGIRRKAQPRHQEGGWPIGLCARQWARSYEILLEDVEHLDRVHWLRYEDFVEAPPYEIAEVLAFLGLEDNEYRGIDPDGSWRVHEREEPIRNMNKDSIDRLTPSDIKEINRKASPMLKTLGYEIL